LFRATIVYLRIYSPCNNRSSNLHGILSEYNVICDLRMNKTLSKSEEEVGDDNEGPLTTLAYRRHLYRNKTIIIIRVTFFFLIRVPKWLGVTAA